ncbi:MAG TPA: hypothetical protein VFK13_10775 [Gemmatimonadaceae bacterium]|nr:hypothetical protein [Gemmatimonadaceae bacterium]
MTLFRIALAIHLLAAFAWLGHMFFWPLFAGPVLKKIQPPETAERLRELSMRMGGLGWPALVLLVGTGAYLLSVRGVTLGALVHPAFWGNGGSHALGIKLLLVLFMIGYQAIIGHRRAPRAIYLDMAAALAVLGMSVMIAKGGL